MVYAVIMAGGSGTRFWPKSTKSLPKQFLNLFGEGTMIQNTAKRIEPIIPQERIMVVTNQSYVPIVKEQLPKVPADNIVGEPVAKNTAPCVAIAAELLQKKDPDAVMVVLPADHHITDPDRFMDILRTAVAKAESGNHLVTIGITPDRAETGFGYIHGDLANSEQLEGNALNPVQAFTEKPNVKKAEEFLASGEYFWNSGMFVWKASTVLKEIENHLPEMYAELEVASRELYTGMHQASISDFYHACESISIDYGIMERSDSVFVVPGEFGWNDVGSWTAVYELATKNQAGNAIQANYCTVAEAENNLIVSESGKMISLVGVDNIAVVETENAILICNLNTAQGVKQIVEQLKENKNFHNFL
jgi:mannose-1-phosphate guanylyltransferase